MLLAAGLVCNLLIRPLSERWFTKSEATHFDRPAGAATLEEGGVSAALSLAWLAVGIPLAWGFYMTVLKASALFR